MNDLMTTDAIEGPSREGASIRRTQVLAGTLATVALCLQQPAAAFRADASIYWGGAQTLVAGGDVRTQGMLDLRGVATAVLYLPAAAVSHLAGGAGAAFAVLFQNALLIAVIGALLLPALIRAWRPLSPRIVWASTAGCAVLLSEFAPHPLADLWAAALLLAAVGALCGHGKARLIAGGLAAGLAFNLRPAVLFAVVTLTVVIVIARRTSALWFIGGGAIALLPQVIANLRWSGSWLPWPESTAALTALQARFAAYTVRYDTVAGPVDLSGQFYCSPQMAGSIDGEPPDSAGGLIGLFLGHPFHGAVMAAQKISAALHWPIATPYYTHAPGVNALFALTVTAVVVVGLTAFVRQARRRGVRRLDAVHVAMAVVALGSLAALVSSATETRFAMVPVLLGVAGCASLVGTGPVALRGTSNRRWALASVLVVLAVFAVGTSGLQHPAVGVPTVADCANM